MREEVAVPVSKNDVRDDLLKVGIVLDLGARLEEVALTDHGLKMLEVLAHKTMPRAVWKDVLAPDADHRLERVAQAVATIRIRPRPKTAISSAVRSMSSSAMGRK